MGEKIPKPTLVGVRKEKTDLVLCPSYFVLTLRRDRGHMPPLEVYRKFLGNRAPEAHQNFFQLLKFCSASFSTICRPAGANGGHQWPPGARGPILSEIFKMLQF